MRVDVGPAHPGTSPFWDRTSPLPRREDEAAIAVLDLVLGNSDKIRPNSPVDELSIIYRVCGAQLGSGNAFVARACRIAGADERVARGIPPLEATESIKWQQSFG